MEREFSVGNKSFKLRKVDAFKQFHIVRRLAPVLKDLIPIATKMKKGDDESESVKALAPILDGISKLSDKDADFVLINLLCAVEMKQESGAWARVATPESGMMFDNLDLPLMLNIAGRAFMYNIEGFFSALPQVSHE